MAGEPGDRRSVSRKRFGREESPDSDKPSKLPLAASEVKGNAPGNARGLHFRCAIACLERGYGKCHRK